MLLTVIFPISGCVSPRNPVIDETQLSTASSAVLSKYGNHPAYTNLKENGTFKSGKTYSVVANIGNCKIEDAYSILCGAIKKLQSDRPQNILVDVMNERSEKDICSISTFQKLATWPAGVGTRTQYDMRPAGSGVEFSIMTNLSPGIVLSKDNIIPLNAALIDVLTTSAPTLDEKQWTTVSSSVRSQYGNHPAYTNLKENGTFKSGKTYTVVATIENCTIEDAYARLCANVKKTESDPVWSKLTSIESNVSGKDNCIISTFQKATTSSTDRGTRYQYALRRVGSSVELSITSKFSPGLFARNDDVIRAYAEAIDDVGYRQAVSSSPNEIPSQAQTISSVHSTSPDAPQKKPSHDISSAPFILGNPGDCYALVIGNNEYQKLPKLSTAVNDAEDIAKALGDDYGFRVTLLKNATRGQTLKALYEFRKLGKDDRLLIYYAGHGWLDTKADEGYWLPVDASRDDNVDWIQNATITAEARACNAKQILIVADSCYSGKLVRGIQVVGKNPDNSESISDKKARLVMSSGGLEPVADASGKNNHSVFASAFLDTLKANSTSTDGASFYTKVREKVGWNADQTPEYGVIHKSGHDGGDFIFIRKSVK